MRPLSHPAYPRSQTRGSPHGNHHTIRPSKYGYKTYGELCNDRQTLGFIRLCRIIAEIAQKARQAGASNEYASALAGYAASVMVRRFRQATRGARLQATKGNAKSRGSVYQRIEYRLRLRPLRDRAGARAGNLALTRQGLLENTAGATRQSRRNTSLALSGVPLSRCP